MIVHSHFKFTNQFEGSDFLQASKDPERVRFWSPARIQTLMR